MLALGSPLALSQSVTMGIVSNTEMIMPGMFWPFNRMTLDGEDVGSIVRWIGHDAAIFGGNSGGPLVNMQGEIVGINEISLGLAGAIPADLAREVAESIMRDGRVKRGWIGLEIQPLLTSSKATRGALVGGTIDGSPAADAGFASGDILVKLAGRDVLVRFAEEVPVFNQFVMRLPDRETRRRDGPPRRRRKDPPRDPCRARERRRADSRAAARRRHGVESDRVGGQGAQAREPRRRARPRRPARRSRRRSQAGASQTTT